MRKVLYILGQLTDADIAWMAATGSRRTLDTGERLITAGEAPASVFIVLDGRLRVLDPQLGVLAELASGEVVGEMSFLDAAPPEASVESDGAATVLEIDRRALQAKLDGDAAFGQRFYRALALFMADRLRGTVRRLGFGDSRAAEDGNALAGEGRLADELDDALMDTVSEAGDRFRRLLRALAASDAGGAAVAASRNDTASPNHRTGTKDGDAEPDAPRDRDGSISRLEIDRI